MILRGIPASPGIAIGYLFLFESFQPETERRQIENAQAELLRYSQAVTTAVRDLDRVRAKAEMEIGTQQATIFSAQALMLQDPELTKSIQDMIVKERVNAEYATQQVAEQYAQKLEAMSDEYLKARASDIRDVANRVLIILNGKANAFEDLEAPAIIMARDLAPSDTVLLDKTKLLGFATAEGGATSHTAILARQLGIPAVVGLGASLLATKTGSEVVLDGELGEIHIALSAEDISSYRKKQAEHSASYQKAMQLTKDPAITRDGHRVEVVANIGNPQAAVSALQHGAEGVGLFRTEFLFLEQTQIPSEDAQVAAYTEVLRIFKDRPVILRTVDVGGDKEIPYLHLEQESNPFLGLRGIRLCLAHPEIFKPQLRAALRSAAAGNLKIMFPMVSTTTEIQSARTLLDECRAELEGAGEKAGNPEIGIMVEVPAAAILADKLAPIVDFFSIGTNDLSQYTMAADRTNARVSGIASALEPAVLRLIKQVIDHAHAAGKWVGLCGELAGEPLAIPILLGMELDEFSMNSPGIPRAKQVIRNCSLAECRKIVADVLLMDSSIEVRLFMERRFSFV